MTPTASLRPRLLSLYAVLIAANLGAWGWALIAFRDCPLFHRWGRPAGVAVNADPRARRNR